MSDLDVGLRNGPFPVPLGEATGVGGDHDDEGAAPTDS